MGPRADLDGRKISSPPGFDPGQSSSVTIPTELPGPLPVNVPLFKYFYDYIIIIIIITLLSPSCKLFIITCLTQTMFLGYILLQLSFYAVYGTCNVTSHAECLVLYVSIFRSKRAVPNVAVFCSSWMSCFPGILLRYFLNNF